MEEIKNPEPQEEKGAENDNSGKENEPGGEDQPENPEAGKPEGDEPEKVTIPEGYVPKEEYDALDTRYKESSGEALFLREQLKKNENTRRELTKEPTEQELRAAFPDWDELSDAEQRSSRLAYEARRDTAALRLEREQEKAEKQWNDDLESAIDANPALEGRESAFKEFANKPSRKGVDMELLVNAFLHDAPAKQNQSKPLKQGLESPNGGPRDPVSSKKKWTGEERLALQKSDPRKYREMLMRGDFDGD